MGKNHQAVFGIFDGHSGSKAAQYCCEALESKLKLHYTDLKSSTIPTLQQGKWHWSMPV